jgi:hypothetical protein
MRDKRIVGAQFDGGRTVWGGSARSIHNTSDLSSRPGTVHADDSTRKEPVRVDVLNVGDIPPDLLNGSQR